MSAFPFPKLLAFLESEADQVEFMKVAAEVGLAPSDLEIAKLLLALQLYKAFYASIPRSMKSVHNAALSEMRGLRDGVKALAERTSADAASIREWADRISQSITAIHPEAVTRALHQRLLDETRAAMSGSVQALAGACSRLDTATGKLNAASSRAEASIGGWQTFSLRRIWFRAVVVCAAFFVAVVLSAWFLFFRQLVSSLLPHYVQYPFTH
jgi:hypothetical protein